MSNFRIADHAHVCSVDGYSVILDLRANKYLALGSSDARALAGMVPNWPEAYPLQRPSDERPDFSHVARTLEQCGVLTRDAGRSRRAPGPAVERVQAALLSSEPVRRQQFHWHHVLRFFFACAVTAYRLRLRSFYSVVRHISERKRRRSLADAAFDPERTRNLVRVYARLRPFLFTEKKACLFDSLALLEFLSSYDLFPIWVIGVEMDPFAAHSWVQQGPFVFNDTPEHAGGFTPIMTV